MNGPQYGEMKDISAFNGFALTCFSIGETPAVDEKTTSEAAQAMLADMHAGAED